MIKMFKNPLFYSQSDELGQKTVEKWPIKINIGIYSRKIKYNVKFSNRTELYCAALCILSLRIYILFSCFF